MADLALPRELDSERSLVLLETARRASEGCTFLLFRRRICAPLNWNECDLPMNSGPELCAAG
jgi:hypothetical protein